MTGRSIHQTGAGLKSGVIRTPGAPSIHPRSGRGVPPVEEIRHRVQELDPSLSDASSTFRAALFILAALRVGQNMEKLAFYTRIPRSDVSRFARRLLDNGVWRAGETVSLWRDPDRLDETFWLDAAVAAGGLCRREVGGDVEWAPPGHWHKWNEGTAESEALPNLYTDPHPEPEVPERNADLPQNPAPDQGERSISPPAGDLFPGAPWLG